MTDKTIVCKDCQEDFTFTAGEQEFYELKGFEQEPKRCKSCRDKRKAEKQNNNGNYHNKDNYNFNGNKNNNNNNFTDKNEVKDEELSTEEN